MTRATRSIIPILLLGVFIARPTLVLLGCSVDYAIWMIRSDSADPLFRFVQKEKAGYINQRGKIVIPPRVEAGGNDGGEFHEGLVSVDDGYLNSSGQFLSFKDLISGEFSEGLAEAEVKGTDRSGYIDRNGKFVISAQFGPSTFLAPFSDGMARIEENERVGFIDKTGSRVIPPRFFNAFAFHEGRAWVVAEGPCLYVNSGLGCPDIRTLPRSAAFSAVSECKFALIDKSGSIISEKRFEAVKDFAEDTAPVRLGKLWGFVDSNGATVIEPRFSDAEPFSGGLAVVSVDGRYGYINHQGVFVIPAQFRYADSFSDGLAVVGEELGGLSPHYIDQMGKAVITGHFITASRFYKGLAHVKISERRSEDDSPVYSGEFAYIDHSGKIVFKYTR
jgi:hypothetical protein